MTCSQDIATRLRLGGYRLCSACQDVLDRIDQRGIEWADKHKQQLARMINANLRRNVGKVPLDIRRRWIERQITLAIKITARSLRGG